MEVFVRQVKKVVPEGELKTEVLIEVLKECDPSLWSGKELEHVLQIFPQTVQVENLASWLFDPGATLQTLHHPLPANLDHGKATKTLLDVTAFLELKASHKSKYELREANGWQPIRASCPSSPPIQDYAHDDGPALLKYICDNNVKVLSVLWLARFIEQQIGWNEFMAMCSYAEGAQQQAALGRVYGSMCEALSPLLLRSQDLAKVAPNAFWDSDELAEYLQHPDPRWPDSHCRSFLFSLSYGWAAPANPDPFCLIVFAVVKYLYNEIGGTESLPPDAPDFPLFWDHKCLPQRLYHRMWNGMPPDPDDNSLLPGEVIEERTNDEACSMRASMNNMSILYQHPRTYVLVYPHLPSEEFTSRWNNDGSGWGPYHLNPTPYGERGWPLMEILGGMCRGSISFLDTIESGQGRANIRDAAEQMALTNNAHLIPPDAFDKIIATRTFTNGADRLVVAENYKVGFHKMAAAMTQITINSSVFQSQEILDDMCKALSHFKRVEHVGIFHMVVPGFSSTIETVPWYQQIMETIEANAIGVKTLFCSRPPTFNAPKRNFAHWREVGEIEHL